MPKSVSSASMPSFNKPIRLSQPYGSDNVALSPTLTVSRKNYDSLYEYVTSRIYYAKNFTNNRAKLMDEIDRQLLGAIINDSRSKANSANNRRGRKAKVTDINLSLGQSQLDTCLTALIDMLLPTNNLYEPFAGVDKMDAARALTAELNKSASKFNHLVEYNKAISDILRYDLGGIFVDWVDIYGNRLASDSLGNPVVEQGKVVYSGNRLTALDMRNTFYDQSVPAESLSANGQYAGFVELAGRSRINELIDSGKIFAEYVRNDEVLTPSSISFNRRPELHSPAVADKSRSASENLDAVFDFAKSPDKDVTLTTIFIKIRPALFGLSQEFTPAIWCFRILGDKIVFAEQLINAHGRLPIVLSSATLDSLGSQMISHAEQLIPMQNFCSYLINVKQRAYRKQLYGLTFYDKTRVDLRQVLTTSDGDFENMYVPVDVSDGQGINSLVQSFNDAPDTTAVMTDIQNAKALMQDLLPTDSRQSLANLSRVSQWQAQRTVRETDKRTIKIGRLLNETLIAPIKFIQVFNLLQFKNSVRLPDENGEYQDVSISELRDQDLELKISSALRGIDKDLLADKVRDMFNVLAQIPAVNSQVDLLAMLNHWSELVGDDIDLDSYRVKSPFDALSPEQKQAAYQLLQAYSAQQQSQTIVDDAASTMPVQQG